ncbi:hypothetical protein BpHYR1_051551 [Brachionus plicatilis]|uniref:Uncharacterized protein n=1 Tax=Brachionus plicatilis TaxID=10195 RepID=A0A3M7Q227_BRAPC|nr:hypothetical protein BpHYR1_051551 [Brachionus plicatilis]
MYLDFVQDVNCSNKRKKNDFFCISVNKVNSQNYNDVQWGFFELFYSQRRIIYGMHHLFYDRLICIVIKSMSKILKILKPSELEEVNE